MEEKNSITVIMPAYNAAKTIEKTFRDIPAGCVDEIILVDDCSTDETIDIARSLGITVVPHTENRGYGANQKTCYQLALQTKASIIVMLHPDYQYDARIIPLCAGFINAGICDTIIGSRIRTRKETLESGMPRYKYFANRLMTFCQNLLFGQNLGDFHSGFRVFHRSVLETIAFENNADSFVFDSQCLAQIIYCNFRIGDVPIPARYFPEASSIDFKQCIRYGLGTVWVMMQYVLQKTGICQFALFSNEKKPS